MSRIDTELLFLSLIVLQIQAHESGVVSRISGVSNLDQPMHRSYYLLQVLAISRSWNHINPFR